MPKLLDRPGTHVDTRESTDTKAPAERRPQPPIPREPKRFIRWMGLLTAFVVVVAIAAVIWVSRSSDDAVLSGEPWTAQARGVSEFTVEPGAPWSPATRGLTVFARQAPWTAVDRGLPIATLLDVPWTPAARGMP